MFGVDILDYYIQIVNDVNILMCKQQALQCLLKCMYVLDVQKQGSTSAEKGYGKIMFLFNVLFLFIIYLVI